MSGCPKGGAFESLSGDLINVREELRLQLDRLPPCMGGDLDFSASVTFNYPQSEERGYQAYPQTEYWVYTGENDEQCAEITYYTFPRHGEIFLPSGSRLDLIEYDTTNGNFYGPDKRSSHMEVRIFSVLDFEFSQNLLVTDVDGDGGVDQISDSGDLVNENRNIHPEDSEYGVALSQIIDYRRKMLIEALIAIEAEMIEISPQEVPELPFFLPINPESEESFESSGVPNRTDI